jgi:hypothetical protein
MMRKSIISFTGLLIGLCLFFLANCSGEKQKTEEAGSISGKTAITPMNHIDLWNGEDFNGWKLFVPDSAFDVSQVWSIQDGNLYCSGIPNGYIRTVQDYTNYKLFVEWRWPEEPGNSGVLLHMSEPDKVWPKSIEAQLQSGNAGDIWLIEGTEINEHTDKTQRRIEKRAESSENTPGEWNKYEITCKGDVIELKVNGVLQNVGTGASVQSGKICLQSEGKPIEFRAIYMEPVE